MEQFEHCYMIAPIDIADNQLFYIMCKEFVELVFKGEVIDPK